MYTRRYAVDDVSVCVFPFRFTRIVRLLDCYIKYLTYGRLQLATPSARLLARVGQAAVPTSINTSVDIVGR